MGRITVRTLGTMRIDVGRGSLGPSAGQVFALLFYLVSRREHATPRRVLMEMLFRNRDNSRNGSNLRQLFYRLRQLGVNLRTDADVAQIAEGDVWIDWLDILNRGELGTADLEQIASGLFPGYAPDLSEEYREWFEAERSTVRLRLSRAVGLQLTQLRRAGRWDLVDVAARAILALDPLNEQGHFARAEALAASGSKAESLRVIDDYVDELGEDGANLRLAALALRRRISERLPEVGHRAQDERIFVGREDAMRMLSAAGAAARAGTQQTVLVWGEPGIGKTRLLTEYKALACLQGALAFQATCQPHDVFRPLGILSDLVAQLLEAPGSLGCDPEGRALLSRLVANADSSSAEHVGGEATLSAIISSLDDLLSAISSEAPLTLFLDDAQWMDRASLRAVMGALSTKVSRRSCAIIASRERALLTNIDGLADEVRSIRLNPLSQQTSLELAKAVLGANRFDRSTGLEEQILRVGRGVPFFIRLLCRHIAAGEEEVSLRQSITEVLESRLEQLSPAATRTLEAAVVLGKNCTYARLAAVLEVNRYELLRAIEELDDRGLIEVRDGCFISSHALLIASLDKRMSDTVKRALHSSAAKLLQDEFEPAEGGSLPWDCAEHWRLAGDNREAISSLRSCAKRALEVGRPTDAFSTLRRALTLSAPDALRLEIIETALTTLWLGVNWAEARDLFAERHRIRKRLGLPRNPHDVYETLEYAASHHSVLIDPRHNIANLRRCVSATTANAAHKLAAARLLLTIAELTLDCDLANFAFESSRSLEPGSPRQLLCDLLYHTCFGSPKTAAQIANELISAASDDHPSTAVWLLNAAYGLYRTSDADAAEAAIVQGLEAARKYRSLSNEMQGCLLLARLYWSTDRFADCKLWHRRFSELSQDNDDPNVAGEHSVVGARLALRDGDVALAERYIIRARECDQSHLDLPRLFVMACDIDLQLATSISSSFETVLADALVLFSRGRSLGCQDDVVLALIRGLSTCGREGEATALVRDYLSKHRRDGFPPSKALLEASARMNVPAPAVAIVSEPVA